ncbi:hypothetical protein HPP92_000131 [Vanilla planifolia]|uniref:DUF7812 domain-containing protein n=1 Tax=Vanilla planifolia TaxID=51239 RepID=A0A835RN86_VANPL|nr:hypothetical protein HPP92_000131 [Vanilla planifolia]
MGIWDRQEKPSSQPSLEVLMEKDLQGFHCLLKELRALKLQGQGKCDEWYSKSVRSVMKMDAGALVNLSSNLYEKLDRQFERLQTFPRRLIDGAVGLYPETQFSKEGFILLLKCCLALLEFLEFDMSLVWEKSSVLVKILIKVCAPDFLLDANGHIAASRRTSDSHHYSDSLGVCQETDDLASLYSSILEVFIAELSENPHLRDHFVAVDVINMDFESSRVNQIQLDFGTNTDDVYHITFD